jgi:hypothetical protein
MAVSGPAVFPLAPSYLDLSTVVMWWAVSPTEVRVRLTAIDGIEDGEDDGVNDEFTMTLDAATFESAYQAWLDSMSGPTPSTVFSSAANSQYLALISHLP